MNEEKFQAKEEHEYWTARAEELQEYEEAELKSLAERAEQFVAELKKADWKGIARSTLPNTAPTTSMQSEQQSHDVVDSSDIMSEDGMGEYAERNTVTISAGIKRKISRLEEQDEQLLPGIPNDVTFDCMCTKLPCIEFGVLSSLNHAWAEAVRSHRFNDLRVCYNLAETLIVHSYIDSAGRSKVAVYFLREKRCYELPSIPQLVPMDCQCVTLNGKIYILGGEDADSGDGKKEVYMFDLASRMRYWQQCASMQSGRLRFGCNVLDEKIFVVGFYATFEGQLPVQGSEVYDPKINAWFPISPTPSLRVDHHIAKLGRELVLYGGYDGRSNQQAEFMEVYCPTSDEWRIVDPLCGMFKYPENGVFTVEGKFYLMTQYHIYVHDTNGNSWEELHSNSFPGIGPNDFVEISSTVAVNNDELVVGGHWFKNADIFDNGSCLLHCHGFRGRQKETVWQVVPDSYGTGQHFTCPIVL